MAGSVHPTCHNSGGTQDTDFNHDVCNLRWPRWLKIELDLSKPSDTFVEQALAALPSKLHLGKDGRLTVPFFGNAPGFIVNYSPDQAVEYDLKGNVVENLSKAFRLGRASFSLKGGTQIADIGRRLEVVEISTV